MRTLRPPTVMTTTETLDPLTGTQTRRIIATPKQRWVAAQLN